MRYLIFISLILSCNFISAQDSTNCEIEKWRSRLPFCDSIKEWYYRWSFSTPINNANGWGENHICQWGKPTPKEVMTKIRTDFAGHKYLKYFKLDIIYEKTPLDFCDCQQRKKAF